MFHDLFFRWARLLLCPAIFFGVWKEVINAKERPIGLAELSRLIEIHRPYKSAPPHSIGIDFFKKKIFIESGEKPTLFVIPGFIKYGCDKCHNGDDLAQQTNNRIRRIIQILKKDLSFIKTIPLKQFILQPYVNSLLKEQQFAHTTFDTIRIFPGTLIIDSKIYGFATQIHETLHLTQPFLGHPNELEAYSLNALADPRFLLFNYHYFENSIQVFFLKDFRDILEQFLNRDTRANLKVPIEVQLFKIPFDSTKLERLQTTIKIMKPIIIEASQIYRKHPLMAAYWSKKTGIPSFILDLAAVKLLLLPQLQLSREIKNQAFKVFEKQFSKIDNTQLGYIVDRKNEALMILRHQLSLKDTEQGLILYFHYLKKRFFRKNGQLKMNANNKEDFSRYIESRIQDVLKMVSSPQITQIERQGGLRLVEWIRKQSLIRE